MAPKNWKAKYSAQEVRDGVECKFCGALVGERCWGKGQYAKQTKGCHWSRHMEYERKMGDRPKRKARGVKVSYICPECGGPHPRSEHPAPAEISP